MDIVLDFDGTCVKHKFPKIGEDIGAVPVLKRLVKEGHRLILSTMRSDIGRVNGIDTEDIKSVAGLHLSKALKWFKDNDIPLYGVQTNPTQKEWTNSPKAYGQLYIDDSSLGIPLVYDEGEDRGYVNWGLVEYMLENRYILNKIK